MYPMKVFSVFLVSGVLMATSCTREDEGEAPTPVKESAATATSDAMSTTGSGTKEAEKPASAPTETVAQIESAAESAVTDAKGKATEVVGDISKMVESTFSVDKLKQMVGNLSAENLQGLASKIKSTIQEKESIVSGLKEKLGDLSSVLGTDAKELKSNLDNVMAELKVLKDKLSLVVENLKSKGLDVSQFENLLEG